MTRVLSYNILVGGTRRIDAIEQMIRSADPDVVGLVEANDPNVVIELAQRLEMEYCMTGHGRHRTDWNTAMLSRLPILSTRKYDRPGVLNKPLLEARVQEEDGRELTVFVTHLSAAFSTGRGGESVRKPEVRELLRIMSAYQGTPHLLMGDFNALAPRDSLKASRLLRYLMETDKLYQANPHVNTGHPYLDFVIPPSLRFLKPALRMIVRSDLLCTLFDKAGALYAPRGSIRLLLKAGYVDTYRRLHPHEWGFTCPAQIPAGRIDYIFASPELAERLESCQIWSEGNGLPGYKASDHLPVVADFAMRVKAEEKRGLLATSGAAI
ncbi:MAG TPA: endonuclease/exonuclease/phosphatase family protein [Ktedonobacteraceae bacterium]|jgi:endonuclease/exonuclease/phosphatase family metal-dependent hydrolase|nr:endonuclease/exonuclease/phosphatase family protein [Ktedonobacteraceae bacterium]